ncbi:MAG TPA: hypothetical protein VKT78_09940 [Fimbriimonadaceae bacterium]|nr:hypothetical protein [Fimbriimonadaceae bacterium]
MNQELDTRACKRLLNEIADLCDHASLTGSMSTGARRVVERYNSVLRRLEESGQVPAGLFGAVPETADFGEIGVEARMLAGYLRGDDKFRHGNGREDGRSVIVRLAPFIGQSELKELVIQQAEKGTPLDVNTITALAPFLGQEYLSKIVRDHLLRPEHPEAPSEKPQPPSAPPAPGDSSPVPMEPDEQGIGHLLDRLQDPTLPDRERQHIIERIRIATG